MRNRQVLMAGDPAPVVPYGSLQGTWTDDKVLYDHEAVPLNWSIFPGTATTWDRTRTNQTTPQSDTVVTVAHIKLHVEIVFAGLPGGSISQEFVINSNSVWSDKNRGPGGAALDADLDILAFYKADGTDNTFHWQGAAGGVAGGSNSVVTLVTATLHLEGTGTKPTTSAGATDIIGPIWDAVKPFVPWITLAGLGLFGLQVFLPSLIGFTRGIQGAFGLGSFGLGGGGGGYGPPPQYGQGQPVVIVNR